MSYRPGDFGPPEISLSGDLFELNANEKRIALIWGITLVLVGVILSVGFAIIICTLGGR